MKLDFEQRQEAERLLEMVSEDEDLLRGLIYELLTLRAAAKSMTELPQVKAHQ